MKININNYEEFFMLYADNELNESERLEVEEFLSANPEYRADFDLLMSTVISPTGAQNTLSLSLLKLPSGFNAEEAMLLEVDGELPVSQRKELDQLCKEFPMLEKEREFMSSIKLDSAEQIRFEDKSVLYRHESRVISIRMWKPAIAAALIGVGLFFGMNETNRVNDAELVGVQENGAPLSIDPQEVTEPAHPYATQPEVIPAEINAGDSDVINSPEGDAIKTSSIGIVSNSRPSTVSIKHTSGIAISNVSESAPRVLENINNPSSNYSAYSRVSPERNAEMNMTPPDEIKTDVQRLTASRPMDVNLAVQRNEVDGIASGDEVNNASIGHVLVVDEEKVNRSKFGGFVRKVKRTIEKKANIKMPEVTLAGYEIAIK